MKIATFNINGIKARLPRLVEWLEETQPDVACLQELKSSDETMPTKEIEAAGYGFLYHGQKGFNGVAILARDEQPVEIQRGLEGEAEDEQSRYLEADVRGVRVGCIYLPNGNPQPGPKFDYKLRWMARLRERAKALLAAEIPVILAGDYNDDGQVDAADYIVWRKLAGADFDLPNETASPGDIDIDDFAAWQSNFGATAPGNSDPANAPEPATMLLVLPILFAVPTMRRCK